MSPALAFAANPRPRPTEPRAELLPGPLPGGPFAPLPGIERRRSASFLVDFAAACKPAAQQRLSVHPHFLSPLPAQPPPSLAKAAPKRAAAAEPPAAAAPKRAKPAAKAAAAPPKKAGGPLPKGTKVTVDNGKKATVVSYNLVDGLYILQIEGESSASLLGYKKTKSWVIH